jgi:pyrroloquinoline quinone (PQQ) biosynthesis protein C
MTIQIVLGEAYKRAAKRLRKKYRHLEDDVQPLIDRLQRGETPGDLLQGYPNERIYKVRLPN